MIFHSGGSLVWKKAGCAEQVGCVKSCGTVGWRRFPCAGKLVLGSGLSSGLCGTGGLCEGLRRCGLAEIPVCGEAGGGQRFEQWALRNR